MSATKSSAPKKAAVLSPVDALKRIAYLLERSHADTYKVRAFRHAATAIEALDVDELQALADSGGLKRLEGVGDSTAKVIVEALGGTTPAYLAIWKRRPPGPPARRWPHCERAPRRLPQPLGLVRRWQPDPGDGRGGRRARARVPGPHRSQPPG